MYMLNLLFDPDQKNGRFESRVEENGALDQSRAWLELKGLDDPDLCRVLNPEAGDISWRIVGREGSLLLHAGQKPRPFIAVRIAPVSPIDAGASLHTMITFGREPRASQPYASPFAKDDERDGPVRAVFDFRDASRAAQGWYFPLGQISHAPNHRDILHRYEFSVGVIYNDGERFYGHDPQMDIGM